ncbi:MAG: hypothetical protein C0594_06605 [Marinilabiliales bacterium]|nr:MAG: hypothetical protein C0594_06605 [Marinilabiliales bacterium]
MKLTESFLKVHSIGDFLVNILMIAIIPAIGEELLFRGIIQKLLIEWTRKTWLGIVLTAIIFSAIHFQFYGFIPRFLLGMLFGYLLIWSKNIWLPIFAHFINNGTAVFVAFLISKNSITKEAETVGSTGDSLIYGVFSLMICGFLLFLLFKKTHRVL